MALPNLSERRVQQSFCTGFVIQYANNRALYFTLGRRIQQPMLLSEIPGYSTKCVLYSLQQC